MTFICPPSSGGLGDEYTRDVTVPAGGADAFDALASRYDALFSPAANPLIALARARVHAALARHFAPGSALLEVGCGTGEDTLALAERGHTLVACDPAPQMLSRAEAKLTAAGRGAAVRFVRGSAATLASRLAGARRARRRRLLELRAAQLRAVARSGSPAARAGAGAGGTFRRRRVAARLPAGDRALPGARPSHARRSGASGARRWPTSTGGPSRCAITARATSTGRSVAGFRRVETRSLGLCLPPLSFGPQMARTPRLLEALAVLEDRLAGLPGLRNIGDHVIVAYERI